MEPLVPAEDAEALEDEVLALIAEANRLAGRLHPILRDSVGDLVRSMNCYYSNLVEGHDTHPRDIDRALANDFSSKARGSAMTRTGTIKPWNGRYKWDGNSVFPTMR